MAAGVWIGSISLSEAESSRVRIEITASQEPVGHFTLGSEVFSRSLHDGDRDGWCDLWASMFPQIARVPGADSDGDGMTDYEEMILMQDPTSINALPRKLTEEELEELRALHHAKRLPRVYTPEEAEWIRQGLAVFIEARKNRGGFKPNKEKRQAASRELAKSFRKMDALQLKGTEEEQLRARRARHMTSDSYAAKLIGADQLWPGTAGVVAGANGADPLPVTGKPPLPPIGVWDLGGVNSASGFGVRLISGDSSPEATHAVLMSKIIGWNSGSDDLRGLAWESRIKNFDLEHDHAEMLEEATNHGMIFSNHSYSPEAGWKRAGGGVWYWWGPRDLVGEDPEFGAYSLNSKSIDGIIYRAQTYLPVYSAGNDATDHGPIRNDGIVDAEDPGYLYSNGSLELNAQNELEEVYTTPDPSIFHPSDSGVPQGGAVIPESLEVPLEHFGQGPIGLGLGTIKSTGSAKNNLTVGAVLADTFTVTDSENIWLSVVSSRGPTDDHRLKPDLVASASYQFLGYASGKYGTTSEAAATVTGLLGQLNEINVDGDGPEFLASTWKALLLNTAIDGRNLNHFVGDEWAETFTRVPTYLGDGGDGPGDDPVMGASEADLVGPDPFFGYGMANAPAAADLLRKNLASRSGAAHLRQHLLFDPSSEGANVTIEIPIEHDGTSPEIRIMLCWTDPPYQVASEERLDVALFEPDLGHTPDTNARLVNDLDLRGLLRLWRNSNRGLLIFPVRPRSWSRLFFKRPLPATTHSIMWSKS